MFKFLNTSSLVRFATSPNNQNLLKPFGIVRPTILRNLTVSEFYEYGINFTPSDHSVHRNEISSTGAFVAYSGAKTG